MRPDDEVGHCIDQMWLWVCKLTGSGKGLDEVEFKWTKGVIDQPPILNGIDKSAIINEVDSNREQERQKRAECDNRKIQLRSDSTFKQTRIAILIFRDILMEPQQ